MENHIYQLRTSKCWQGSSAFLTFQVSSYHRSQELPKKFYLNVDCNQISRGCRFTEKRSGQIKVSGSISSIIRKYISSAKIMEILESEKDGTLVIPFYQGGERNWCLFLNDEKPPQLSLISKEGVDYFRYGQKGVFTKRKSTERNLSCIEDAQTFKNILPNLMAEFLKNLEEATPHENDSLQDVDENLGSQLGLNSNTDSFSDLQKTIRSKLSRRLKTVKKSIEKHKKHIPLESEIHDLELQASLLQSYAYLIKPNEITLKLDRSLAGTPTDMIIELDPDISVGKNVENYFKKLKKFKKALKVGEDLYTKYIGEKNELTSDLELVKTHILEDESLLSILEKHKIKHHTVSTKKTKNNILKMPFMTFTGPEKVECLVGKSPSDNDTLTRSAKSNDYWFHVVEGSGSHVIVPSRSLFQGKLTEDVKKDASILALHFSKLKNNGRGEVYITQRRHLKKDKGCAVGLWIVKKSETFYIRYSPQDLQKVLARKKID